MLAEILIIGAGAAGLAAALTFEKTNTNYLIIEARDRVGGRVHGHMGAEFIHGTSPSIWDFVHAAGLPTEEAKMLRYVKDGKWKRDGWDNVNAILAQLAAFQNPDRSIADFVKELERQGQSKTSIDDFVRFAEGFNAADINKISVASLVKAEEESEGDGNFRLSDGYDALITWMATQISPGGLMLNTVATRVTWNSDGANVETESNGKITHFNAKKLLVTLPLGVWKSVEFVPPLDERAALLQKLEMGDAVRVVLEFDTQLVRLEPEVRFFRDVQEPTGVWWFYTQHGKTFWVNWAGGPSATSLLRDPNIKASAVTAFARIFDLDVNLVHQHLKQVYFHNWSEDPFSRGAYSYIGVDGLEAQGKLAEPIENVLFFAGEMIPPKGQTGTVDAAMGSGLRAAKEMLRK